jgi:hypothetical protein
MVGTLMGRMFRVLMEAIMPLASYAMLGDERTR